MGNGKRRVDAQDTVDSPIGTLTRLQAEGWAVEESTVAFEHVALGKEGRKLPVAATLTVRLVPGR